MLAEPSIPKHAKTKNIQVLPAVLDAARKDGEELLRESCEPLRAA
jgi:hypothetical protein